MPCRRSSTCGCRPSRRPGRCGPCCCSAESASAAREEPALLPALCQWPRSLTLPPLPLQYEAGDAALSRVVAEALERDGVLFCRARYSKLERCRPPPSIRVAVTALHTHADLAKAAAALKAAAKRVLT